MARKRTWGALAAAWMGAVALVGGGAAGATSTWTTYHGNAARTGVDSSEPNLSPVKVAWSNSLDGAAEYGQPVVAEGRVFVASEDDNVYALDAHDGHVLWSRHIGSPLTNVSQNTGCGNIDPLGITSTPVVDLARNTVFVVGEVSTSGGPPVTFRLVGFNIFTGSITLTSNATPALPPGESPIHLQQRAALAVGNGRVYVAYGGLVGDCGLYHGWVVGVDEAGSRPNVDFNATPGGQGGAIWNAGAGPSLDSAGNVYVVTGNPNGTSTTTAYADYVVKLDSSLRLLAAFHDPNAAAGADADLGTGNAVILPNGTLFAIGKSDVGYVLRQSNLSVVRSIPVNTGCGDPDGGPAYDPTTGSVYVPCRDGDFLQQIELNTFSLGWHGGSVNGAPILVDGHLWALQYNSGVLKELDAATGATVQSPIQISNGVPNFASPSSADGLLLIGTHRGITALDGPSGPPPPAPAPPRPTAGYWMAARDGGVFSFGTAGYHGSLGGVPLNAPIVGMARTPTGRGYWLVAADGGVFTFGDARFYGSTGAIRLAQPIVGMAAAPNGSGYWLVARDGGVFSFGPGARFYGSTGTVRLARPVVGMAADPVTGGYWLVASDGGIFSFHSPFLGSAGGRPLAQPVEGMAATAAGNGYWLVARDGGVFSFGPAARFHGSTGGAALVAPIVGMAADAKTGGYWLVASDGGVFAFGAPFEGSTGAVALVQPIVGMAAS